MLKTLQARLQQYMNSELPDVQTGFRKARVSRDQIANIHWIIEKARDKLGKTSEPGPERNRTDFGFYPEGDRCQQRF